ncbi:MAG: GNAT family N-acetyltransferase [Oscillospiraceae bacterium]
MLNHKGTIILETNRLILRQFEMNDAQATFDNWCSKDNVSKYMRWKTHQSIEETKSMIGKWIEGYKDERSYHWIIVNRQTQAPIGTIGLFIVNEFDMCGVFGYCLDDVEWGKGYTTEALNAVLEFAFEQVGFNRIEAEHSVNNPASGKVMQKVGMTFEGVAKQKYKCNLGFQDCNLYGITANEYNNKKG